MNGIKFIVSDESVNCNGFTVLTSGINLERFKKNPIMLYMHDRNKGVIGRWENIRKEGLKLVAEAIFDESNELGLDVKKRVENGFLRCASIGIENVIYKDVAGVQTVTQCDLYEISIVDIPANQNAVKLYAQGRKPVHALSQTDNNNNNNKNQTFRGRIIDVLGLGDNATDEDIINEIKALKNSSTAIEKEVDDAVNNGLIARNEKDVFLSLAKGNRKAFRTYCSNRALIQESEIRTILKENSNKVITQEQGVFERIGKTMGAEVLRQVFSVMSSPIKLTQILNLSRNKNTWSLDDYRKFAPDELKDNPNLYARLLSEKSCNVQGINDLNYYRKYNPEYLAKNPDFYQQLIEKERNKQ